MDNFSWEKWKDVVFHDTLGCGGICMSGMWRYGVEGDGVWCGEGKMIALCENIRNMHIGY